MHALVREPGPSFAQALSTHPGKGTIDFARGQQQHASYIQALTGAGADLIILPPLDVFPDSVFVEDTTLIFDSLAVACPMREQSRKGEALTVIEAVRKFRPQIGTLSFPATLDGGDVLNTGARLFVGLSGRTNREAVTALSRLTGKPITAVPVRKGLHLKSGLSYLGNDLLVIDPQSVDVSLFDGFRRIEVAPEESYAANCLALGNTLIMAAGYPRLEDQIRSEGFDIVTLEMSEFEKADGGITCLSLIIPEPTNFNRADPV